MGNLKINFDYEFNRSERDIGDEIIREAATVVANRLENKLDIKNVAQGKINESIVKIIDELVNKQIPVYSPYGEKKNETITIKEMIYNEAKKQMDKRDFLKDIVDSALRNDSFRKSISSELTEIREKYQAGLKNIIQISIEQFIKQNTK